MFRGGSFISAPASLSRSTTIPATCPKPAVDPQRLTRSRPAHLKSNFKPSGLNSTLTTNSKFPGPRSASASVSANASTRAGVGPAISASNSTSRAKELSPPLLPQRTPPSYLARYEAINELKKKKQLEEEEQKVKRKVEGAPGAVSSMASRSQEVNQKVKAKVTPSPYSKVGSSGSTKTTRSASYSAAVPQKPVVAKEKPAPRASKDGGKEVKTPLVSKSQQPGVNLKSLAGIKSKVNSNLKRPSKSCTPRISPTNSNVINSARISKPMQAQSNDSSTNNNNNNIVVVVNIVKMNNNNTNNNETQVSMVDTNEKMKECPDPVQQKSEMSGEVEILEPEEARENLKPKSKSKLPPPDKMSQTTETIKKVKEKSSSKTEKKERRKSSSKSTTNKSHRKSRKKNGDSIPEIPATPQEVAPLPAFRIINSPGEIGVEAPSEESEEISSNPSPNLENNREIERMTTTENSNDNQMVSLEQHLEEENTEMESKNTEKIPNVVTLDQAQVQKVNTVEGPKEIVQNSGLDRFIETTEDRIWKRLAQDPESSVDEIEEDLELDAWLKSEQDLVDNVQHNVVQHPETIVWNNLEQNQEKDDWKKLEQYPETNIWDSLDQDLEMSVDYNFQQHQENRVWNSSDQSQENRASNTSEQNQENLALNDMEQNPEHDNFYRSEMKIDEDYVGNSSFESDNNKISSNSNDVDQTMLATLKKMPEKIKQSKKTKKPNTQTEDCESWDPKKSETQVQDRLEHSTATAEENFTSEFHQNDDQEEKVLKIIEERGEPDSFRFLSETPTPNNEKNQIFEMTELPLKIPPSRRKKSSNFPPNPPGVHESIIPLYQMPSVLPETPPKKILSSTLKSVLEDDQLEEMFPEKSGPHEQNQNFDANLKIAEESPKKCGRRVSKHKSSDKIQKLSVPENSLQGTRSFNGRPGEKRMAPEKFGKTAKRRKVVKGRENLDRKTKTSVIVNASSSNDSNVSQQAVSKEIEKAQVRPRVKTGSSTMKPKSGDCLDKAERKWLSVTKRDLQSREFLSPEKTEKPKLEIKSQPENINASAVETKQLLSFSKMPLLYNAGKHLQGILRLTNISPHIICFRVAPNCTVEGRYKIEPKEGTLNPGHFELVRFKTKKLLEESLVESDTFTVESILTAPGTASASAVRRLWMNTPESQRFVAYTHSLLLFDPNDPFFRSCLNNGSWAERSRTDLDADIDNKAEELFTPSKLTGDEAGDRGRKRRETSMLYTILGEDGKQHLSINVLDVLEDIQKAQRELHAVRVATLWHHLWFMALLLVGGFLIFRLFFCDPMPSNGGKFLSRFFR